MGKRVESIYRRFGEVYVIVAYDPAEERIGLFSYDALHGSNDIEDEIMSHGFPYEHRWYKPWAVVLGVEVEDGELLEDSTDDIRIRMRIVFGGERPATATYHFTDTMMTIARGSAVRYGGNTVAMPVRELTVALPIAADDERYRRRYGTM